MQPLPCSLLFASLFLKGQHLSSYFIHSFISCQSSYAYFCTVSKPKQSSIQNYCYSKISITLGWGFFSSMLKVFFWWFFKSLKLAWRVLLPFHIQFQILDIGICKYLACLSVYLTVDVELITGYIYFLSSSSYLTVRLSLFFFSLFPTSTSLVTADYKNQLHTAK